MGKTASNFQQMMRKSVLAMADLDEGRRPWAALLIIAVWFGSSLVQDACSARFMAASEKLVGHDYHIILPVTLTLIQVIVCACSIRVDSQPGESSPHETICVIVCSHLCAMFLSNIWFQIPEPEFGIVGGFVEPLMCLLLMLVCMGTCSASAKTVGLGMACFGMTFFSINVSTFCKTNRSVIIKLLCGVFFILRNMCVGHLHHENMQINPRSKTSLSCIAGVLSLATIGAVSYLSHTWVIPLLLGFCACVVHTIVTYIACGLILAKFSIPTFCLMSAGVQFVEAWFLVTSSAKPALVIGVVAIAFICLGLCVFIQDGVDNGYAFQRKTVSTNEMLTRIQFLVFAASIFGVVFYGLQPKISQRDLHTLSYVGLDTVLRRLLSIDMEPDHEH